MRASVGVVRIIFMKASRSSSITRSGMTGSVMSASGPPHSTSASAVTTTSSCAVATPLARKSRIASPSAALPVGPSSMSGTGSRGW